MTKIIITDEYLAGFEEAEAQAILESFRIQGFKVEHSFDDCFYIVTT